MSIQENVEGTIVELLMHPNDPNDPMIQVDKLELLKEKGIVGNSRYFDTKNKTNGTQNKNHISMTEQEQIDEFKKQSPEISSSSVRSNVITSGLCIDACTQLQIGNDVIIKVYKTRCSCKKMDRCVKGLREIMKKGSPGVMAEVLNSGTIRVGDKIKQID